MKSLSPLFTLRALAGVGALLFTWIAARAQPVEWVGGGASVAWGQAANWAGGTAPAAGADLRIATGTFASPDAMALNADRIVGSVTFDNAANQFPSLLRLNANVGTGTTTRVLTLNSSGGVLFNVVNGANVFISGNSSTLTNFAGLNLTLNYSGAASINVDGTSTLSIGGNAANFKAVSGQTAGLSKTGAGTLTLSGGGSNYTGGFHLAQGTVLLSGSSNTTIGHANAGMGPFGYGTLTLSGGTKLASSTTNTSGNRTIDNVLNFTGGTVTLGDATNNGLLTFTTVTNLGTSTISGGTVLDTQSNVSMNRALEGSGSLTKTGTGTLTLVQQASYTGGTILQGGMLQLQDSDKLPVGGAVTFDGGMLRVSTGPGNVIAWTADHATTITASGGTFNLASGINLTWAGNITGAGALNMNANSVGTLTLTGTNSYTGGTVIDAGTVRGSIGPGNLTVASGATYDLFGAHRTVAALSGEGEVTLGASTLTAGGSTSSTFSGNITGSGGLTKAGSGTLTLSGVNGYTGPTAVNAGTLAGVISTADLAVASGAAYALGGADRTITTLSGTGGVVLGANTLTTDTAADSTFAGAITGTGGLTKAGTGTLTLAGNNTFTGATQVSAGGLAVNGSMAGPVTLGAGTTLSGTGNFLSSVSLGGTHNPGNSAGIQAFNNLTYQAGSNVNWELTANTIFQSPNPNATYDQVLVGGTLSFAGATTLTIIFNGSGSTVNWNDPLWWNSQSWVVFSSANTIDASNLTLNTANWLDSAGNDFNTVLAGATLDLDVVNGNILLNYTAIPEPSTYAMMILGGGMLALFHLRRRRNVRAGQ